MVRLPAVHVDAVVALQDVPVHQPVVQLVLLDRRVRVGDPRDVVPVLPLAVRHRPEDRRLGPPRQRDRFPRLAQLVVRNAAVVAKVLRVHLADDERVARPTALDHVPLRLVDLHRVLVPQYLQRV